MRSTTVAKWLAALFILPIIAAPSRQDDDADVPAAGIAEMEAGVEEAEGVTYSVFNGIKVPAMVEISGENFAETVKDGYW